MQKPDTMRILLQQISSGEFVTEDGRWTQAQTEAKAFAHFLDALVFARDQVRTPVGAYCVFQDPSYNFSVYLRSATAALQWEAKVKPVQQLDRVAQGAQHSIEDLRASELLQRTSDRN